MTIDEEEVLTKLSNLKVEALNPETSEKVSRRICLAYSVPHSNRIFKIFFCRTLLNTLYRYSYVQGCGSAAFFADPDPANFLIAGPNYFLMRIRIQLKQICKKLPLINSFLELKKTTTKKDCSEVN